MDITDGSIRELGFSFYTSDEVRSISVLEIKANTTVDRETNRCADGGFHDLSLGPCDTKDTCMHCGLAFSQCPGHAGHIELHQTAYNPMLYSLLKLVVKSFCFTCFRIYPIPTVAAALHLLGLELQDIGPVAIKGGLLDEFRSYSPPELRKLVLRLMCTRHRTNCEICGAKSWALRKETNHLEIIVWPAKGGAVPNDVDDPEDEDKSPNYRNLAKSVRSRLKQLASSPRDKVPSIPPVLLKDLLRCAWLQNSDVFGVVLPFLNRVLEKFEYPTDAFFMDVMLVTPSICRFPRMVGGKTFASTATSLFSEVFKRAQEAKKLGDILTRFNLVTPDGIPQKHSSETLSAISVEFSQAVTEQQFGLSSTPLSASPERCAQALRAAIVRLQAAVNAVYDNRMSAPPSGFGSRSARAAHTSPLMGLKQRLEKKQGLFRMHMMGKRVNYACRSVISPDPNLRVLEVGVPLFITLKLTFPEAVTAQNVERLRKLVLAGPDVYPGAKFVQMPDGIKQLVPGGNNTNSVNRRQNLAKRLAPPQSDVYGAQPIVVHRHLEDGDYLVMNRQPTLHRPSMQAHRARIIRAPGAKTLRLHYAICKAYNADFDGDEMNGHFPQNYQSKAELASLSAVPYQYLAPKDGSPLGGLIQDHVIAAVKLTIRDRFFDQDEYLDLVYYSLYAAVAIDEHIPEPILLPPAIIKPNRLWTGKQVVSTLLMNIVPRGLQQLNAFLEGRRTKAELWAGTDYSRARVLSDVDLVIVEGYVVSGLLDKAHIGSASGGLVHCVYEAYGPFAASQLLSGISRMADRFLKISSFTMSLADIMLNGSADKDRKRRFQKMAYLGLCAFADAFQLPPDEVTEDHVKKLYRRAHFAKKTDEVYGKKLAALDVAVKNRIKHVQDVVCDSAIPSGLYTPFPANSLQLMVHVGAKGGMVNAQQMSVALGQIELEGRRVPLMLSGRTLPSFPPYDIRPRAGGLCTHRFLTSMPPQEFFFHSMAGRDGLVDTACKTSRSGYLQRSLIKHLEDLAVKYDGTVRDAGGSVIQFRYGDDGVDVCQASFLKPQGISFFAENAELLMNRWDCPDDLEVYRRLTEQHPLPPQIARAVDEVAVKRVGVLERSLSSTKLVNRKQKREKVARKVKESVYGESLPEPPCAFAKKLRTIMTTKITQGQAPPGEPVGLLAAQSIGEPSTQMTLNTFHFAGLGEMNVTLGIPRLREVLMTGSRKIATPCMEVPIFSDTAAKESAENLVRDMYRLRLVEVLKLPLSVEVDYHSDTLSLKLELLPESAYSARTNVKPQRILSFIERCLFLDLGKSLKEEIEGRKKSKEIETQNLRTMASDIEPTGGAQGLEGDDGEEGPSTYRARDEWGEDDGAEAVRRRRLEDEDEEDGEGGVATGGVASKRRNADEDDDEAAELHEIGLDPERESDEEDGTVGEEGGPEAGEPSVAVATEKQQQQGNLEATKRPELLGADEFDVERGDDEQGEDLVYEQEDYPDPTTSPEARVGIDEKRVKSVVELHPLFVGYTYDTSREPKWAKLTISMYDPDTGRLSVDMRTLVHGIITRSVISSVTDVQKAFIDKSNPGKWVLRVEGVNLKYLYQYPNVFDLRGVYTNDIHVMQETFGIEAAREVLQREVSSVFGHYGISVDSRHLGLVADYLTHHGAYHAFNRRSMDYHPSPLQRVTFETATAALKTVIQENLVDNTNSPSGCLVAGQLIHSCGTTCFDLLSQLSI